MKSYLKSLPIHQHFIGGFRWSKFTPLISGVLVASALTLAAAQAQETEPNNACSTPQDLGAVALPTIVSGSLDSTLTTLDIDFFRIEASPGQSIRVDFEGQSTDSGSLAEPLLGLFDSGCSLLAIDVYGGVGANARLSFVVPAAGAFVLGATAYPDYSFIGGGVGTYRLTVTPLPTIDSIAGRLVDDMTGLGLPGTDVPYSSVQLLRCNEEGCYEFVNYQQADTDGRFLLDSDQSGNPITVGTYQLFAYAQGYEYFFSEPFEVFEGEARDLGDLRLVPLQLIGSISGRLVDAIDGRPLSGYSPPYPYLYLQRCEEFGCYVVASSSPDDLGRFRFDGVLYLLSPGTYQVIAFAEDYRESRSASIEVGAFKHVGIGDLPITPFPIQFGAVQGCEILVGGGLCEYGIEVLKRGPGHYKGAAWSAVEFYPAPSYRVTRFQVGRNGASHPAPLKLNLKQGQREMLTFQLEVPASVPDGSFLCATAAVGSDPSPQFDSQGDRYVFCASVQSGGFEVLSGNEGRKRLRELRKQEREAGADRPR